MAVRYEKVEALREKENAIIASILNAIQDQLDILHKETHVRREETGCWDAVAQNDYARKWISIQDLHLKILCRYPNSYMVEDTCEKEEAISLEEDVNVNEEIVSLEVDMRVEEDSSMSTACIIGEEHFSEAANLSREEKKDLVDNKEHESLSEVNAKLEQKLVSQDENSGQDWKATADNTQNSGGTGVVFIASGSEKPKEGLQIVPMSFQDDLMITNLKEKELEDKKNNLSPGMWRFYILPLNIYMIGVLGVRSYVKMYNGSCNGLNPEQQVEQARLIDRHLTCFSSSTTDLGRTSILQHEINTRDAQPENHHVLRKKKEM